MRKFNASKKPSKIVRKPLRAENLLDVRGGAYLEGGITISYEPPKVRGGR